MNNHSHTLIEAQGAWLRTFEWGWYFTGTFAKPVTAIGARFLLQQYVKSLQQNSGTDVNMYWVVERGAIGGNVHVHGLVGNVGTLEAFCGNEGRCCTSTCGTHLWRCGKAQVSPYRIDGAAPFYISKVALTGERYRNWVGSGEWDIIGNPIPITAKEQTPITQ